MACRRKQYRTHALEKSKSQLWKYSGFPTQWEVLRERVTRGRVVKCILCKQALAIVNDHYISLIMIIQLTQFIGEGVRAFSSIKKILILGALRLHLK